MKNKSQIVFFIIILFLQVCIALPAHARTLEIGTIERPPFMMKDDAGKLTGFSVDLWRDIAKRAGISYRFVEFSSFPKMIESVKNRHIDAAIANISITSKREKDMDFSQPIYPSGLQIMVPVKNGAISFLKVVWESGILKFVAFAVFVLLLIAHILWFFERNVTDKRHDYFRDDYFGGVWDAFWWAFIIMTMGGFENEVPHKVISRALAIFWIVTSLFFVSALTAKITTSLTVSELSSSINSVSDLKGKRVGIINSRAVKDKLARFGVSAKQYESYDKLYKALSSGELDAVVGDAPVIQYYVAHKAQGKFKLVGDVFAQENYGILFPENAPIKDVVDRTLIQMQEDGSYRKIYNTYFAAK